MNGPAIIITIMVSEMKVMHGERVEDSNANLSLAKESRSEQPSRQGCRLKEDDRGRVHTKSGLEEPARMV